MDLCGDAQKPKKKDEWVKNLSIGDYRCMWEGFPTTPPKAPSAESSASTAPSSLLRLLMIIQLEGNAMALLLLQILVQPMMPSTI